MTPIDMHRQPVANMLHRRFDTHAFMWMVLRGASSVRFKLYSAMARTSTRIAVNNLCQQEDA